MADIKSVFQRLIAEWEAMNYSYAPPVTSFLTPSHFRTLKILTVIRSRQTKKMRCDMLCKADPGNGPMQLVLDLSSSGLTLCRLSKNNVTNMLAISVRPLTFCLPSSSVRFDVPNRTKYRISFFAQFLFYFTLFFLLFWFCMCVHLVPTLEHESLGVKDTK